MMLKFVTVICPVYNEEMFIEKCFNSILKQDYPHDKIELFFVDGRSTDNTRGIIDSLSNDYGFVKLLDNPFKVVPHALNIGIKQSKGEVIIRIDGHCEYPQNYISTLIRFLFELNADNVGALWNTLPSNQSVKCRSIALATSHNFGVGNSHHKVGVKQIMEVDTVPFGCFKREVFDKIGLFDEDLIRNQDDEFNARIINNGGKIFIIPELVIDYHARDTIGNVFKMYFQYGLFKPLVNKKLGKPATIRQFVPVFFVFTLLNGILLSFFFNIFFVLLLLFLSVYLIVSLFVSLNLVVQNKHVGLLLCLPLIFFVIHFSYGFGYFKGLYNLVFKKKFVVDITR